MEATGGKLVVDFDGLKSKRYDTSADFTNDIETLESVSNLVVKFVDCHAFSDWVDETDSNYANYKADHFNKLVEAAKELQKAVKAFNEHIYELDV